MKHKTLFRLSIKFLGLALLGFGLPEFVTALVGIISMISQSFAMSTSSLQIPFQWATIGWAAGPALQIAIALYLLIGGEWLVNRFIPSNRPYCPDCGYDVSRSLNEQCPECGAQLPLNVRRVSDDGGEAGS